MDRGLRPGREDPKSYHISIVWLYFIGNFNHTGPTFCAFLIFDSLKSAQ